MGSALALPAHAEPPAPHAAAIPPAAPKPEAPAAAPAPATRTPPKARDALTAAAQESGTPSYVSTNGRVYVNATTPAHLAAMDRATGPGTGVLQIMQTGGTQHTKAKFEGQFLHFQYINGTNNWRMRPWADRMRPSNNKTYSAMIQLTPAEAENLRRRIQGIFAEEGPEENAGQRWENGRIRNSTGVPSFNCASVWCNMPIGEHGEPVAKIIGIPSVGDPFSLQQVLESGGNERIFGIGVYGAPVPGFGTDKNARVAAGNTHR
jgi:hypothetical protein